jgi:ABC-2 type transport system ATP-binding protein
LDNECVDIIVKDAEISLAHLVEIFIKNNVAIKKISINKPILDDVFLKYVGGRIESSDRISEVRQMRRMIRMG